MKCGVVRLTAPKQKKSEAVVRAGKLRLNFESTAIAADCLRLPTRPRIRDRHVLEHTVIRRLVAECKLVRRQSGLKITLTLEREPLAEIIEALLLILRFIAAKATPERHRTESTDECDIELGSE